MLPSFCNYPLDTAESFKDLGKALCSAIHEDPDVRGTICSSLQILIQQNKKILEDKNDPYGLSVLSESEIDPARERLMAYYTPQVAADNLSALRSSAHELLSVLSTVFLKSRKDDGGCLQVLKSISMKYLILCSNYDLLAFT